MIFQIVGLRALLINQKEFCLAQFRVHLSKGIGFAGFCIEFAGVQLAFCNIHGRQV